MSKKLISVVLVLAFMVVMFTACAPKTEVATTPSDEVATEKPDAEESSSEPAEAKKIAFLINCTTSQYSGAYYKVFQEEVKNYPEVDFTIYDGQENATTQAQQVDEAIANGVDLIMLWPQDSKALVAAAKKASEAGIEVLVCNNGLDASGDDYIVGLIGPDYYMQGKIAADAMNNALPNGGKFVHLGCDPSYEAARLRLQGFLDQVEEKGYALEMLGEPAKCEWNLELGKSNMTAFLSKYAGEIDAVYAVDDTIGNGALQAIQEDMSGKNKDVKIISIGGIQVILDAIKAGENYYATIYQSPFFEAPASIKLAVEILNGKVPEEKFSTFENPIITSENVGEFEPAY